MKCKFTVLSMLLFSSISFSHANAQSAEPPVSIQTSNASKLIKILNRSVSRYQVGTKFSFNGCVLKIDESKREKNWFRRNCPSQSEDYVSKYYINMSEVIATFDEDTGWLTFNCDRQSKCIKNQGTDYISCRLSDISEYEPAGSKSIEISSRSEGRRLENLMYEFRDTCEE